MRDWHFYDHKCGHGVMFTRHVKRPYFIICHYISVIIISHYVLTKCKKCLIYSGFYCFSLVGFVPNSCPRQIITPPSIGRFRVRYGGGVRIRG